MIHCIVFQWPASTTISVPVKQSSSFIQYICFIEAIYKSLFLKTCLVLPAPC